MQNNKKVIVINPPKNPEEDMLCAMKFCSSHNCCDIECPFFNNNKRCAAMFASYALARIDSLEKAYKHMFDEKQWVNGR